MRSFSQRYIVLNERNALLVLFALLYVYLWLRAFYVPAFCDEIATFYHYVQSGSFMPYNSDWDANNHFLNSALTWLSYSVFGHSLCALRLPNLLIAPLLFYAVYKIGNEIPDRALRILWIITLLFNHYFIEFLALGRGYGMSMVFILMAVWFTFRIIKTNKTAFYVGAGLMGTFAILSNLTLIYSVLILLAMIVVIAIIKNQDSIKAFFTRLGLLILLGILPALWAISYLFEMKSKELLYYGIEGNFWEVTVKTLAYNSVYGQSPAATFVVAFLFALILLAFIIAISKARRLIDLLSTEFVFYYLLIGNIALLVLQHYLLGLNYPEDRIGLFLIPFFMGSIFFAIARLRLSFNKNYIKYLAFPLLYIPLSFLLSANFTYITYWKFMGLDERFYTTIDAASPKDSIPPVVGGSRVRHSLYWAFFNYTDQGRQNLIHYADSSETTDDYLIGNIDTYPGYEKNYNIIDYDALRDIHLLQRKTTAPRQLLARQTNVATIDTLDESFFLLISGSLDTLSGKDLFFGWDLTFYSPDQPYKGAIILDVQDQNKNSMYYYAYQLHRQRKIWDGSPRNAVNGLKYSNVPASAKYFKLYLWNVENQDFLIRDGEVRLSEFVKDQYP